MPEIPTAKEKGEAMTIAEMIAVLQAAERGEAVQARACDTAEAQWVDVIRPSWHFDRCEYRIKPKPRMVPLEPSDVPPGSVIRCSPETWCAVGHVCLDGVIVLSARERLIRYVDLIREDWEISRDGGRTWSKCEKPESV